MRFSQTAPPSQQLQNDLHEALNQYHRDGVVETPLLKYALFQQKAQEQNVSPRQVSNEILLEALQQMERQHPADAQLLRLRFLDRALVQTVANKRNVGESKVYVDQRRALTTLTEIVWEMEQQVRLEQRRRLERRLEPPNYGTLIGIDAHLDQLSEPLLTPGPPWLIAISGLGGIGKTTLADTLVRRLVQAGLTADVGWVSARQELLNLGGSLKPVNRPALTAAALVDALVQQLWENAAAPITASPTQMLTMLEQRLKARPHLIVIDNLETLLDLESLLPTLRRLANPTKFLLTSREQLYNEPDIYHFLAPELSERDALALVRQEARLRNLAHLLHSSEQQLGAIYATVGGNPLALRLVVGQTHAHPLAVILQELTAARGAKAEQLYTFIYRRAWDHLDELSRQVLLAMVLTPPGGDDAAFLAGVTHLDEVKIRSGLDQLIALNLVDSRGDLEARRYTIHNLTRTFLQQQVIKWQ